MADCIQQDTNVLATSPSASRGPGVKKLVSKAILKSVIDINEDECNRCPSDLREGAKMLLGIKTVKSAGGKTNDKDMNAAKMVDTGNPKMTMSRDDSIPTTLVVQWCEAAVIVGPEGGIIKDLELSTGARIKVETGKVKYKGTRIVALLIAQVKGGNQWSDGSGNFLENQVLERNNE